MAKINEKMFKINNSIIILIILINLHRYGKPMISI